MTEIVQTLVAFKLAIVAGWFALFFVLERWRAAAPVPPSVDRRRRLGRNGGLWLVNSVLSLTLVVPVSAWAAGHHLGWRPDSWHSMVLDLAVLELLIYWWHRANHAVPLLWRFHATHHLDRTLDTSTAIRFHFGEVMLSALARAAIIMALDIPLASILVFEIVILLTTIFHHSNVRLPHGLEAALALVIITPSIHWVHHHAVRSDTNANYGIVFSFWDRLFRTMSRSRRTPAMEIGIEGEGEEDLGRLLLRPFVAG